MARDMRFSQASLALQRRLLERLREIEPCRFRFREPALELGLLLEQ